MITRKYLIWLFLCLGLIQVIWLVIFGVRSGGDTSSYLRGADLLMNNGLGAFSDPRMYFRISYIAFVSFHKIFTENIAFMIYTQVFVHVISAMLLFYTMTHYCSRRAAALLVVLFTLFPYMVRWNFFILSESLTISGSVLIAFLIHRVDTNDNFKLSLASPFLIAYALIRPHSAVIVFGFLVFYMIRKYAEQKDKKVILFPVALILSLMLMIFFHENVLLVSIDKLRDLFIRGQIIPKQWYIDMTTFFDQNILYQCFAIVKLFFYRIVAELGMVRSYYSIANNLHLICYAFIIYGLTFLGLFRKNNGWLKIGLIITIIANYGLIGITFASWDGRFGMYVMPQLWILMAMGVAGIEGSVFMQKWGTNFRNLLQKI